MIFLLIAGCRDFTDSLTFENVVDGIIADSGDNFTIIEGGATGADTLARDYAIKHGIRYIEFPADWNRYGRGAGPKRNAQMTAYARERGGRALFFWDGKSRGTAHCIRSAKKAGIPIMIWDTINNRFSDSGKGDAA